MKATRHASTMTHLIRKLFAPQREPGPSEHFELWLSGNHEHLVRYARVVADTEEDARSILSAVIGRVMQAFYAAKVEEDRLLPYTLRALKNEALKTTRRNERRQAREQPLDEHLATCEHASLGAIMQDERALIENALRRLPGEHALILRLVYWEGLSFADIARAQGIPKSTVRYRYERAMEQLKRHFPQP